MNGGGRQGQYVKFDDKMWRILYDDVYTVNSHGLQIICEEVYDGDGVHWENVAVPSNFDIDGDSSNLTKFEKIVYYYNNMIELLNNYCESLISNKPYILNVRSIGTNPIINNHNLDESDYYTSTYLENWPETSNKGKYNGKIKGDFVKKSDYEAMDAINYDENNYSNRYYIYVGRKIQYSTNPWDSVNVDDECIKLYRFSQSPYSTATFAEISKYREYETNSYPNVLPVVTLNQGALMGVEGDGTEGNPYILD